MVAGEVRNLASRSAQAAKEIKALIEDSVSRVDTESSVLVKRRRNDERHRKCRNANDRHYGRDCLGLRQAKPVDQVALAVSEMDRVTQQNASLVQESAAAAAALEEQANRLTQSIVDFPPCVTSGVG